MTEFGEGDIVKLKSGGPDMTVERISVNGLLLCSWATDEGTDKNWFYPDMLQRADAAAAKPVRPAPGTRRGR